MLPILARNATGSSLARLAGLRWAAAASANQEYSSLLTVEKHGPGGRSSVSGVVATVFGSNGFVGSYIVNELAKCGSQVVCPFRSTENEAMHLKQMGDLGQVVLLPELDIRNDEHIKRAISRSNVVINCVGMRLQTMNWSFEDVHVDFPKRLAKIAAESGHVDRLIHFSDMGADVNHKSKRMRTKALGDEALLEAFPSATIMRPGDIVGIEDHFYNYLIYQLTLTVFAPVVETGSNKLQPTYVLDVADAVTSALRKPESKGQTYYLGGPEVLTVREVYDLLLKTLRIHRDDTWHLPAWIVKAMYKPMDSVRRKLPGLPMTSPMATDDYVEECLRDKVVPAGVKGYADLDIVPQKVTDGLPIEPVRHARVGGYRWGDMANVAKDVPESVRKYYNIKQ
ncbi:NADH:ubiquinone oxidoreductase 39 kDa subunit [Volvox carteri f. nagariensis]|uniref:NADH:ubiquinone oxidoreductase 39 kDa subunit n=1 Tax=Volvox carteri f. nagariensis TaxID=3068 RepID=D8U7G8_VOLCA|nr:NADH:ubiquinone oxidoreductase 39 kDa subunit [Volvox carteri f. nagariensis]EFJ44232.1 NADH:ubiquinone oxidoreductase 39 kDa subunit [Volvox carteri f. nagariensis]|eukprot:XP_002954591.1 NADH:ubiquinone oxidoreductase 39 kDa subunit [Volvox carteri f. nagariensis]